MTERLHFHFSLSCIGEGNGNPLQCSCLENPRDRGAWWAAIYGVAQSGTWLKRLSKSLFCSFPLWYVLAPSLCWPKYVCSFSTSLKWSIKLLIWDLCLFLEKTWIAITSLRAALLHPIDFGKSCLHFHLSSDIFWCPLWLYRWLTVFSVECYLVSMCAFFPISFL